MTAWAMSAGEVLQEELAAACLLVLLLVAAAAAGGVAVARRYTHALQSTREYRQPSGIGESSKRRNVS